MLPHPSLSALALGILLLGGCTKETPERISVPAGGFFMGCNPEADLRCDEDEKPFHEVRLDAFEIDTHEVTVGEYARCVREGPCAEPGGTKLHPECNWGSDRGDHQPVNCVSWQDARAFCAWKRMRLPTEAEWEKAARGADGRSYPWGDGPKPDCARAVVWDDGPGCGQGSTLPVGSKPKGASPYGAQDMLGNVYEWVADWYDAHFYARAPRKNPRAPSEGKGPVIRGGAYTESSLWVSDRSGAPAGKRDPTIGFRCAR